MERVVCDSGIEGWRAKLQENYDSYEEWEAFSETFALAERLGYDDPLTAWEENPLIQGSTNPDDFRRVRCDAATGAPSTYAHTGTWTKPRNVGTCLTEYTCGGAHGCGERFIIDSSD